MTRETGAVLLVPRAEQRRVRWKNGAGWTTELVVRPEEGAFDWRISVAEVEVDSEFSRFPAIDRTILVLEGAGFDLWVEGEPPAQLRAGGPPHAFSGDRAARCVVAGPSRDFNVMTRRGRVRHAVTREAGEGARAIERARGVGWVIYVVDGEASAGEARAGAGECLVIEPGPEDRETIALRAAGARVVVRLQGA